MDTTAKSSHKYGYRWVILGLSWTAYSMVFISRLSVGPLAPFYKEDMGMTNAELGIVIAAASLGFMLTCFPAGLVVDRIGARLPLTIGELIIGISMILLFFLPSYVWLLILMLIAGLGGGILLPATTQGVMLWFKSSERATVVGIMHTPVNIASVITAATLPAIALSLSWSYGFLFIGIISVAIGVMAPLLYKEPPVTVISATAGSLPETQETPLLEIIKSREIWLVGFCGFCMNWVEMAILAHLVVYLKEALFYSVVAAGGILAMLQVPGFVGRPGWGFLSDRLFRSERKHVFMIAAGSTSASCLAIGFLGSHLSWAFYPILFVLGLGALGFGGLLMTFVSEFGGKGGIGKASGLGIMILRGALNTSH